MYIVRPVPSDSIAELHPIFSPLQVGPISSDVATTTQLRARTVYTKTNNKLHNFPSTTAPMGSGNITHQHVAMCKSTSLLLKKPAHFGTGRLTLRDQTGEPPNTPLDAAVAVLDARPLLFLTRIYRHHGCC
ncbi:hypothetical protein BDR07DRAFT_251268 [Suillus spraguei]|nr:hypothetical protein BDR07DRAFT_251268 [Suillus spraguei]